MNYFTEQFCPFFLHVFLLKEIKMSSLPLKEMQMTTLVSPNPIESLLQSFKPKCTGILYFCYLTKQFL